MSNIDTYAVAWHEPGRSADDSMPLGNGDIGLNVWTDSNGDLLFYIGKTDAWDDYGWTPWEKREDKLQPWGFHKYHWVGSLERVWMLPDVYGHTG